MKRSESMYKSCWSGILGLAVGAVLCGWAPSQVIQLHSGEVLVGEVEDATGDGLSFRRLDNGGLLELRWQDLSAEAALRVRRLKGLVVEDEEEATIPADVVVYALASGIQQEVVGILTSQTDSYMVLTIKGKELRIRRSALKRLRKRDVPVLQVYTRDGYLAAVIARHEPGEDADKHVVVAQELRRAGDYENAEKHLLQAQALGGGKQRNQIAAMLERVKIMREAADERQLLTRIKQMRRRSKFGKAAELIEEFKQAYPDTKLAADFAREQVRYEAAREKHMLDKAFQLWDRYVRAVANEKVAEPMLTLAAARDYAEQKMKADVYARVSKTLELKPEEVEAYWSRRNERENRRNEIFHYGVGSWVLGEEAVIKGTKVERAQQGAAKGGGTGDQASQEDLKRLMRKLREAQKQARRRGSKSGKKEQTEEGWWQSEPRSGKQDWLRAYFAEFSGTMELTNAYTSPCGNCVGRGTVRSVGSTGKDKVTKCPVCQGTKYTRGFRAR